MTGFEQCATSLPGSEGMWSPRWSPRGDFIAGISQDDQIRLYDIRSRKQSEPLAKRANPSWSPDGQFLYFSAVKDNSIVWRRLRISDRKVEFVGGPKNIELADFGWWFALAPDGAVISARDTGANDIYALDWELP